MSTAGTGFATVFECPECEARYLDERRCPDCHLFCRRIGTVPCGCAATRRQSFFSWVSRWPPLQIAESVPSGVASGIARYGSRAPWPPRQAFRQR